MATKKKTARTEAAKTENNKYEEVRKNLETQKVALLAEAGIIIGGGLNPEKLNFPDVTDQAAAEADKNFTIRLR